MELELRMFSMVIYQLSGIQAGIQAYHSTIEYSNDYGNDENYISWRTKHKTVVLLNGGTTNDGVSSVYGYPNMTGSLQSHLETLKSYALNVSSFYEPDLNNAMTSISFLVDERIFNKRKYPDIFVKQLLDDLYLINEEDLSTFEFNKYFLTQDVFRSWLETIGGFNNFKIRHFLKDFKLASN